MKNVIGIAKTVFGWLWKQLKLLPARLKGAYVGFTKPDSSISA